VRARGVLAAAIGLLTAATAAAAWVVSVQPERGLRARVFRSHAFDGLPLLERDERDLAIETLAARAGIPAGEPFGIQWLGWVYAPESGRYAFDLSVDDGAEVWFGDRLVVEVKEPPGIYRRHGFVEMTSGLHPVEIRYRQFLGERRFSFRWSRPSDRRLLAGPIFIPPSDPAPSTLIVDAGRWLPLAVALGWSTLILGVLATGFVTAARLQASVRELRTGRRAIAGAIPLLLITAGLTWGSYPWRAWHPDEVLPGDVMDAVQHRFSGGWFELYPPVQYVVHALVFGPLFAADRAGAVSLAQPEVLGSFHVGMRVISVVMALLTLLVIYEVGRETLGRSRAAIAVFVAGTGQCFVYYAKAANVDMPYVFWVTAATLFFLRAARYGRMRDHVALGVTAALAVTTKDQAYGYFAGPALALIYVRLREYRRFAADRWVRSTLFDRRLWAGAAAALVVLVLGYGLPWNHAGFRAHVEQATGFRMQGFRLFDGGPAGQLGLLGYSAQLLPWTFGVVTTVLAITGAVMAARRHRRFRWLWLLTVPAASYYATVIMYVGYTYDRFLLGWALPVSLFAAAGSGVLSRLPASARRAVAAACALAAVVPAAALDAEMQFGSRARLEAFLEAHVSRDPFVVAVGSPLYLPRLSSLRYQILNQADDSLIEWNADLILLNEEWVARVPHPPGSVQALLRSGGYRDVHHDLRSPLPWWMRLTAGVPPDDGTNLLKISPSFTVWSLEE
jgi:4-amino-4-deoxy-L-arabinose transferase-like glycosyltransferase